MKKLLLLCILISRIGFSQAKLVKDINLGNSSSNPSKKVAFNGYIYFIANDGVHGLELWRTDGTTAGTELFKDFYQGLESGMYAITPFVSNNHLYFYATNNGADYYLWKTDGSLTNTIKLRKFSSLQGFHDTINNELIFSAENGLWKTDGSENGTVFIKNYTVFGVTRFIKSGNELFFSAKESTTYGNELYKTDGTTEGTVLVKNIYTASNKNSYPNNFAVLNTMVYFSADNGSSGYELWKTDGTALGTEMVKDINVGSASTFSYNTPIVTLNNELFFMNGTKLWKSDGTETGTVEVIDVLESVKKLIVFKNKVFVFNYGNSFWVSDGTTEGSTKVETATSEFFHNSAFGVVNNELFFQAHNSYGYELWKTDGTASGTFMVKDIHPEFDDNNIEDIVSLNGKAIFTASDGNWLGKELWISDGSELGTTILKDINQTGNNSSSPKNYFQLGNKVLFSADNGVNGNELWLLENGIATLLKDINLNEKYSNPSNFTELDGVVYFKATTKETGTELWKTDGTTSGTVLVKDINPGLNNSLTYGNFVTLNHKLFFYADDGVNGSELWESDGTLEGTKLVKDINTSGSSIRLGELFVFKDKIYFNATDSSADFELWVSDGTDSGTQLFKNINSTSSSSPYNFVEFKENLYFTVSTTAGNQLWRTDGVNTSKATDKGYSNVTVAGNYMYFVSTYANGGELWATENGVTFYFVKDIKPGNAGSNGSFPSYLTNHNGILYFIANDGTHGYELWKSDGTSNGTTLVKDIVEGTSSSNIIEIQSFGDFIVFGAGNNNQNKELWISDGTTEGTKLLYDLNPSTEQYYNGSNPNTFFVDANNTLNFTADNGLTGYELWQLEAEALSIKDHPLDHKQILVYPNPTSGNLIITDFNQSIISVKIYNVLGKEVMSIKNPATSIDVSKLDAGVYLLHINSDSQTSIKKIIKK